MKDGHTEEVHDWLKLSWEQLRDFFMAYNDMPYIPGKRALKAVVVYKEYNWDEVYSLESRSYLVNSDNYVFGRKMHTPSLYGSNLDGSDRNVGLHRYDWEIDYCYLVD